MPLVKKQTPISGNLALAKAQAELHARSDTIKITEAPEFFGWVRDEVWIEDPHKIGGSEIRFNLWTAQVAYLKLVMRVTQTVALKARQLGISWCVIVYCVYLCIFHSGVSVYVLSKDEDAAKEIIRRARFVYKRLRNKPVTERGRGDNQQEIKFSNNSRFKAFPATENAATSFTATFLILDEADKMKYGKELYTSVKPTIDDGGRIAIIFTAFGADGLGRQVWSKAGTEQDGAGIIRFFIPWWERPSRTQEWYDKTAADAISLAHHRQEYPATPEEALGFTNLDSRFLREIALWNNLASDTAINPGLPAVLALDAGIDSDNFAAASVCWHPQKRVPAVRDVQLWVPKETVSGQLDLTDVYDWVRRYIRTRNVLRTVYDPYQMAAFGQELAKQYDARAFSQGTERLAADTGLKLRIQRGQVTHDAQPELAQHIENADMKVDTNSRLRMIKRGKDFKIDLAVATSMAVHELVTEFPFEALNSGGPMSSLPTDQIEEFNSVSLHRKPFDGRPNLIYDSFRR